MKKLITSVFKKKTPSIEISSDKRIPQNECRLEFPNGSFVVISNDLPVDINVVRNSGRQSGRTTRAMLRAAINSQFRNVTFISPTVEMSKQNFRRFTEGLNIIIRNQSTVDQRVTTTSGHEIRFMSRDQIEDYQSLRGSTVPSWYRVYDEV